MVSNSILFSCTYKSIITYTILFVKFLRMDPQVTPVVDLQVTPGEDVFKSPSPAPAATPAISLAAPETTTAPATCTDCMKTFSSKSNLVRHQRKVHKKDDRIPCPVGGCLRMLSLEDIKTHVKNFHKFSFRDDEQASNYVNQQEFQRGLPSVHEY